MSGLEDLYREIILDHYRNPRNRGELAVPPAHRSEGYNPLCGDEVIVYLAIDDGIVSDIRIGGQGCSISQSSASMMSATVKGKTVDEVRRLIRTFKSMMSIHESALGSAPAGDAGGSPEDARALQVAAGGPEGNAEVTGDLRLPSEEELASLGDLAALQGVVKFPVRIKCATLSWNTLSQVLDEVGVPG